MGIKMLIVDDEPVICQGLKLTMPWSELGVEVIGEAYDGLEAMRYILEDSVDLVLTDIKMPGMDGLHLVKTANKEKPDVHFVMMSGYDEFEYARQAIRLGVKDYLMKPIDIDELTELVKRLVVQIKHDKSEGEQSQEENRKQWLLHKLTETPLISSTNVEIDDKLLQASSTGFRIIVSESEGYAILREQHSEYELQCMKNKWKDIVNVTGKANGWEITSVFIHPNILVSIVFSNEQTITDAELNDFLHDIGGKWDEPHRLLFGVCKPYYDLNCLQQAFHEAQEILARNVIRFGNTRYMETIRNKGTFSEKIERQFINALFQQNKKMLNQLIKSLFIDFKKRELLLNEVVKELREILTVIERHLRSAGLKNIDKVMLLKNSVDVHIHNTFDCLRHLFKKDVSSLLSIIQETNVGKNHWIIERVKHVINENYRGNLKSSDLAEYLDITPNYFSSIFKQETGKSFSEYLNEVRIQKAKTLLLQTTSKVSDIAEQVGYKEYKYFAKIFKEMNGITPTEYRELIK